MTQNNFASNPKPREASKLTNMSQRPRTTSEDPSREIQCDHIRTPTDAHTHTHTDAHTHVDKGVETCDFVIDTKKPLIGTLTLLMLWQISPKDPKGEGLLDMRLSGPTGRGRVCGTQREMAVTNKLNTKWNLSFFLFILIETNTYPYLLS